MRPTILKKSQSQAAAQRCWATYTFRRTLPPQSPCLGRSRRVVDVVVFLSCLPPTTRELGYRAGGGSRRHGPAVSAEGAVRPFRYRRPLGLPRATSGSGHVSAPSSTSS